MLCRPARRAAASVAAVALVGGALVTFAEAPASAATRMISGIHWTRSTLDVASANQVSRVQVRIADTNGVCSAQVRIAKGSRSFVQKLAIDSGRRTDGVWGGSRTWRITDRGSWVVNQVLYTDCDGRSWVQSRTAGLGSGLTVRSSKPVPTLTLSSVPSSLLRDASDTVQARLTYGSKNLTGRTIRLRACNDYAYNGCVVLASGTTGSTGRVSLTFVQPRKKSIVLFATYGGSPSYAQAQSSRHLVTTLWRTIQVSVSITGSFDPPDLVSGNVVTYGLFQVNLGRSLCNGTVTITGLSGFVTGGYTRPFQFCTTVVQPIQVLNEPAAPGSKNLVAKLFVSGGGTSDNFAGTSPVTNFVVPYYVP